MKKVYRKGALGALMDEYERAVSEIQNLVEQINDDDFVKIFDAKTENENCRSAQTIISHVVFAAYGYANSIREVFSIAAESVEKKQLSKQDAIRQLDDAMKYTAETLEGKWRMTDAEITATIMKGEYVENLEQLLEHAVVHVLRHRRQIEKFFNNGNSD